jgi:hypothetical protein
MTLEELDWLRTDGLGILERLQATSSTDALALATRLRKELPSARARLIQEQLELRERGRAKFGDRAAGMLFTRRLLEQATGMLVARHKATRLASFAATQSTVEFGDLCCGSGGDALAFAEIGISPILCDLDPVALGLARHNLAAAGFQARSYETRLPELPFTPTLFHLDPDRRTQGRETGEDRWDAKGLSPNPSEIRQILSVCPDGVIKLSPGTPPEALEIPCEREFVGVRDEARELLLWCGALGDAAIVKVSEYGADGSCETWSTRASAMEDAFSDEPAEEPGAFLHEPVKALVRSHLFAAYGQECGLSLLDNSIAWLTGNREFRSGLLKSYRVLAHAPLAKGTEAGLFRETGRSCRAVKKRGVAVVPEAAQKQLRSFEGEPAILAYFRVRGRKWCAVLEPMTGTVLAGD